MGTSCISVQIPCCKPKQNLQFSQVYQPWSGKIEHSLSQTEPSNNPAFNGFAAFWTPKYMPPMPIPIKFLSGPHSGKSGPLFQTLYVQSKASQPSRLRDPSNCNILMSIVYRYIHDTNPSCWLLGYRPFWWFTYFSTTMENKKGPLSIMGSRWVLAAEITPEVPEVRMGCIFSDGFRWISALKRATYLNNLELHWKDNSPGFVMSTVSGWEQWCLCKVANRQRLNSQKSERGVNISRRRIILPRSPPKSGHVEHASIPNINLRLV